MEWNWRQVIVRFRSSGSSTQTTLKISYWKVRGVFGTHHTNWQSHAVQCTRTSGSKDVNFVRKMYQLDANNFTMIFSHKWPLHISDIYMSIFRSSYIYRLFHCCMWCYAIGVEAVVLLSWCVFKCTVCQLDTNWQTVHKATHQLRRTTASTPMA